MPSITLDVQLASLTSKFGSTYGALHEGKWLLVLNVNLPWQERLELGTGEKLDEVDMRVTFRETASEYIEWATERTKRVEEAFGVISSTMAKELQHIRSIRNAFAHSAYPLTFSTDEIATAMTGFAMLNAADSVEGGTPMPRDKVGYLMVVRIICTILDHDLRNKGEDPILDY